jgi:hypothetical protein
MRLCKLQLRYYPPGIILQYEQAGCQLEKPVELLNLKPETDIEARPCPAAPALYVHPRAWLAGALQ